MDMVKSAQEITLMRTAGRILAGVMDTLAGKMHAGMHGEELDATAEEMIRAAGCIPVFKGYGDRTYTGVTNNCSRMSYGFIEQ